MYSSVDPLRRSMDLWLKNKTKKESLEPRILEGGKKEMRERVVFCHQQCGYNTDRHRAMIFLEVETSLGFISSLPHPTCNSINEKTDSPAHIHKDREIL